MEERDRIGRAPVLETERLRLRAHHAGDLAARTAMMADPAVFRFVGGAPQSREENWARIQRYAGQWALDGFGLWAVEERASGRFVGEAGLARFERGLGEDFDCAPEAGWILAAAVWGRGFAGEAMSASLAWHAGHGIAGRSVCMIAEANASSLALAGRLGYRTFRATEYRGQATVLLERFPSAGEAR